MITIEYWSDGQLVVTRTGDRNELLEYIAIFNQWAEERSRARRWIIASNGLRN